MLFFDQTIIMNEYGRTLYELIIDFTSETLYQVLKLKIIFTCMMIASSLALYLQVFPHDKVLGGMELVCDVLGRGMLEQVWEHDRVLELEHGKVQVLEHGMGLELGHGKVQVLGGGMELGLGHGMGQGLGHGMELGLGHGREQEQGHDMEQVLDVVRVLEQRKELELQRGMELVGMAQQDGQPKLRH